MALFYCKACGSSLEAGSGKTVCTCKNCGLLQTLPSDDDEIKPELYNRASKLRLAGNFEDALLIYKEILDEDSSDCEAYWSVALCKYGIKYKIDPSSGEKTIKVTRPQFVPFPNDENYRQALKFADKQRKKLYEEEAGIITKIQKMNFDDFQRFQKKQNNASENGEVSDISLLLGRAFMLLENKDFIKADECCEKVLNIDPRNPKAYLGKLMAELMVSSKDELEKLNLPLDEYTNFKNLMRYADNKLKAEIESLIVKSDAVSGVDSVDNKYEKAMQFIKAADDLYKSGDRKLLACKDEDQYHNAKKYFDDARKNYAEACSVLKFIENHKNSKAKQDSCMAQFKKCTEKIDYCEEQAETARKNAIYFAAVNCMHMNRSAGFIEASELFKSIPGWKDSDSLILECEESLEKIGEMKASMKKIERRIQIFKKSAIAFICLVMLGFTGYNVIYGVIMPRVTYENAVKAMKNQDYEKACELFSKNEKYKDSSDRIKEARYLQAEKLISEGKHSEAVKILNEVKDYKDSKNKIFDSVSRIAVKTNISAGAEHTVAIKNDGTVISSGSNENGQCNVDEWNNIISVSAGISHTAGLRADGTVVCTLPELPEKDYGQTAVEEWNNIISVSAGAFHTVGLKSDGTVVSTPITNSEFDYGQAEVNEWTDIVAIATGYYHTVGLKADGKVIVAGSKNNGQADVEKWEDIIFISAGDWHTVGLKADGNVVATGDNNYKQCDVKKWKNVIDIASGKYHTVALKKDGTVVSTGSNEKGQCDVGSWSNIVMVSAGDEHTIGLKSDGTVVSTSEPKKEQPASPTSSKNGKTDESENEEHTAKAPDYSLKTDMKNFKNIRLPSN